MQPLAQLDQMIEQRHLAFLEFFLALAHRLRRVLIGFGERRQRASPRSSRSRPGGAAGAGTAVGAAGVASSAVRLDRLDRIGAADWSATGSSSELCNSPSDRSCLANLVLDVEAATPSRTAAAPRRARPRASSGRGCPGIRARSARALRTQYPTVRITRGRSLGPMTTSATTAISASSDQAKSNIDHVTIASGAAPRGADHGRSGHAPQRAAPAHIAAPRAVAVVRRATAFVRRLRVLVASLSCGFSSGSSVGLAARAAGAPIVSLRVATGRGADQARRRAARRCPADRRGRRGRNAAGTPRS